MKNYYYSRIEKTISTAKIITAFEKTLTLIPDIALVLFCCSSYVYRAMPALLRASLLPSLNPLITGALPALTFSPMRISFLHGCLVPTPTKGALPALSLYPRCSSPLHCYLLWLTLQVRCLLWLSLSDAHLFCVSLSILTRCLVC